MMLSPADLLDLLSDVRRIASGPASGLKIIPLEGDAEIARGTYELPVQAAVAEIVAPGAVVFDIGANVGFFTLLAARLAGPGGAVHAFEPVERNARAISRSARLNRMETVTVHQVAVGAESGIAELNLARHIGGAMLATVGAPPDIRGTVTVPVVALDAYLRDRGLPLPNVVKIDVEGAELAVIAGMGETLARARPVLVCELDDPSAEGIAARTLALSEALGGHGYRLEALPPSYPDAGWQVVHFLARHGG